MGMSELEPIVSKKEDGPKIDPSKKTMDPETGKKHLIVVASVFGGIFALCLAVAIAGICLAPEEGEPTLLNDTRALYYDDKHAPIGTPVFDYELNSEGTGYQITSISAPESGEAYALVLPQYQQRNFEEAAGNVTGISSVSEGNNIFGKSPAAFSLSRLVATSFISYIGAYSFSGITTLEMVQGAFDSSSLRIMGHAFEGCSSLSRFPFPTSAVYIGEAAFEGCDLFNVDLASTSISQIGDGAFKGNANLEKATLPATLTKWGKNLFEGTALTSISYAGNAAQYRLLDQKMVEEALAGSAVATIELIDGTVVEI